MEASPFVFRLRKRFAEDDAVKPEKRRGRQAGAVEGVMAGLAQGAEEGPCPETPTLRPGKVGTPGEPPRRVWRLERLMAERRRARAVMATGQVGADPSGDPSAGQCGLRRHPYCGPTPAPIGPGRHPSPQ